MVGNPCIRDKSRRAASSKAEPKRCCTGSETTQEGRKRGQRGKKQWSERKQG